jgi:hypothetical protein
LQRLNATLRLAMMNFGTLARPRIRLRDHKVLIAATFADGTTAYFRVAREAADQGSAVLLKLAAAAQGTGEVPAGEVVSVQRVR